jgi:hypothetical protein
VYKDKNMARDLSKYNISQLYEFTGKESLFVL